MSLDVYLYEGTEYYAGPKIYVREEGQTKEISLSQWQERYPDQEPILTPPGESGEVFTANITHNLNTMAKEAGIWWHLWRPDETEITHARQLIQPLKRGLQALQDDPAHFRSFNPKNGWGTYEGLISFVSEYLQACKQYPDATVEVSR